MLAATLASSALAGGCVVQGRVGVTAEPVYEVEEAPPPPREERVVVRPGFVWIRGRWEFRGGHWVWRAGYWQRARVGHVWEAGHWERRGNHYVWIEGRWVASGRVRVTPGPPSDVETRHHDSDEPSAPPPAPRYERPGVRAGYVWVAGHYRWDRGSYLWVPGHWERVRRGWIWEAGHWERRGNHYVWIDGRWRRR